MNSDKLQVLKVAISQIEKQFGKGSIMKLGQNPNLKINSIPTGSLTLDIALGIGGIPRGRITEIYGAESSGKTTLSLSVIAQAQKLGGLAAFIDAEHALDPEYARILGVDVDSLYVSQPDYGEQALEIVEILARSNAIDIIVVDSVAALVPKAELEGDMENSQMGLQARLMSKALRKLTAVINKSKTAVIFINQLREKIGVFFGNPETTPGGRALKFYSSVRIEVKKGESLKNSGNVYGHIVKMKIAKNKLAPPFKTAYFELIYGKGINKESELIDLAVKEGIITKSGSWYTYLNDKLGQGKEKVLNYFKENKDMLNNIENELKKKYNLLNENLLNKDKVSKEKVEV